MNGYMAVGRLTNALGTWIMNVCPHRRCVSRKKVLMRQSITPVTLVLTLVALASTMTLTPLTVTAQVAKVTPMSYDFGQMKQMQTVHTVLTVTNEGAGRLQITSVDADCGCTVPTLETTSLSPGESTEIQIEFNSKRFNGKVHKAVHVNTNDPLNPVIDVMLTANVYAPLLIDPPSQRVGFSRSLVGESGTRRVVFTATGNAPLEISAGPTRKGLFDVKVINNLDGDPSMAAVEITRPATMGPGRQRDNVRITTNIPDFPTADIEMQAWVLKELIASPARITYRFKKSFNQSIRIAPFRKGLVFKVTKVTCDLPEITCEILETIPNIENKIMLSGHPLSRDDERAIANNGHMSGTIKIYANNEDEPVLEVPVSYMVRM